MTQPEDVGVPVEDSLPDRVGTWIDVTAVFAVAGGISWGLFSVIGPYAIAIGGAFVGAANFTAGWLRSRPRPVRVASGAGRVVSPGPEDPGSVHVRGR